MLIKRKAQAREFSNRRQRKGFKLDTLPFSVSPQDALEKFDHWAIKEQGIPYYEVNTSAAFVPVWSFDLNVRFKTALVDSNRHTYSWKPDFFNTAYPEQDIIYLPGLATYSGYTYRRSLVDPVHNKTLLFMGHKTMPFARNMLDDIQFINPENGEKQSIQVFPDPWNATEGTALKIVKDQLILDVDDIMRSRGENVESEIEVQVVNSRRVYLPTYIFDYSVLGGGKGYRSFVSGCDAEVPVSGISHQAFSFIEDIFSTVSSNMKITVSSSMKTPGPIAMWLASNLGTGALREGIKFASRLVTKFPFFSIVAFGIFKFGIPRIRNHLTLEQWKEQREHDAGQYHYHTDHFDYYGSASKRYFELHREAILRILSQMHQFNHMHYGNTDDGSHSREEYQNYNRNHEKQRSRRNSGYSNSWAGSHNNAKDPHHILGVKKSATMSEVSAAFRREMLKHHPDMNTNATEAEKAEALERSKMITAAYRKIKQQSNG